MCKVFLISFLLLLGCKHILTKDEYLKDYTSFIKDVKENYQGFNPDEWKEKDKEFNKFSSEYYFQFKSKLTLAEIVKLSRFEFVYNLTRGNINFTDIVSGKYNKVLADFLSEFIQTFQEGYELKKDIKDIASTKLITQFLGF